MKPQGKRTDLTPYPVRMKSGGQQFLDSMGKAASESRNQIHRYIRLNELIPKLFKMTDEKEVAIRPGVEISCLL